MEKLHFIQTTPNELAELINKGVKKQLSDFKKELLDSNASDDLLTREQTCKLLKINPSTLWHWQNNGKIKAYGISGSRRYYKRNEIMDALKLLKK